MDNAPSREMPRYTSHKAVHALKIAAIEINLDKSARIAPADRGYAPFATAPGWAERFKGGATDDPGYYVVYADGYASWSPTKAFEDGYAAEAEADAKPHAGLPVAGYKPQNTAAVDLVNVNKRLEEAVLRALDDLATMKGPAASNDKPSEVAVDQRWLAIGRTSIENGFMAVNRAVFKPGRVKLPGDAAERVLL
jgi:hypothetical protein